MSKNYVVGAAADRPRADRAVITRPLLLIDQVVPQDAVLDEAEFDAHSRIFHLLIQNFLLLNLLLDSAKIIGRMLLNLASLLGHVTYLGAVLTQELV